MTDNGLLKLYTLKNIATAGEMPKQALVEVGTAYYSERTVGYNRIYAAMGADQQIDMLVRCWNTELPTDAQYVILEDGQQYQISVKQKIVGTDAVDLTLVRVEEYYDVANDSGETEEN